MRQHRFSRHAGALALVVGLSAAGGTAAGQTPEPGPLRVGAARVDITPTPPEGARVRDHLYASAIVIDDGTTRAALIGADQIAFGEAVWAEVTARLAAESGIPAEHVLTTATHAHSDGRFGLSIAGSGATAMPTTTLADAAVEAVRLAVSRLEPARVGFGEGRSYLNVNRDAIHPDTQRWYQGPDLDGESDKTLAVLSFVDLDGAPIALFVNYAMHPINYYLSPIISGDFPAQAARYVESIYGEEVVVVWSQGAEGDQNPLYLRAMRTRSAASRDGEGPDVVARAEAQLDRWIQAMGAVLGEEVIRVTDLTTRRSDQISIGGGQTTVTCPGRTRLDNAREGVPGEYEDGPPVDIRVGMLTIGTTAIGSVNAEIYTGIGQRIKAASPLADTIVTALANGSARSGYIPTEEAFNRYTFQVLGSRLEPGCAEQAILGAAADLLTAATR